MKKQHFGLGKCLDSLRYCHLTTNYGCLEIMNKDLCNLFSYLAWILILKCCRVTCIYAVRLSLFLRSLWMLASDIDFMLTKCCLLHIDCGHSTESPNAPQHNRYSDMLFLSEAPSTWVNGKQLSSIIVSVAFHTLRVAKHVPRLTAHRTTPTIRKTRLLCPRLSGELIVLHRQAMLLLCLPLSRLLL